MESKIVIQSEYLYLSSSVSNVDISSNKSINVYSNDNIVFKTGPDGNKDKFFTVNSQNIVLGYPTNPTVKLEAVPKSDELIKILSSILDIMNEIVLTPDGAEQALIGDINILKTQLYKIKSDITKTY
jgi:hypothetical protein